MSVPEMGRNEWEYLRIDGEMAEHNATAVQAMANRIQQAYPDIADRCRRIGILEKRHQEEIREKMKKSNPHG